ncbi:MAPEG family protein [Duganella sp. P38]|uniref:MAPEG family protein n=1 Tax=Duganella sp. P38 TaxID=3423949 RepID=UPI003D7A39B5
MTIANWCVLVACLLPVATVGLAKGAGRDAERYNNQRPREWAARLTGWRARASAAQQNGFEALPLFVAAVLLAQQAHADQDRVDALALAFVALRLVYIAAYLANIPALRSLVWLVGVATCVALLLMS